MVKANKTLYQKEVLDELYDGLDLHSRNTNIGIMDKAFNRVFKKRVPNHPELIVQTLDPFRDQITGFVVESTGHNFSDDFQVRVHFFGARSEFYIICLD